jgi:hypothetical protein
MSYLDNFDNKFLNKYEKNLKNRNFFIDMFSRYRLKLFKILCNFIIVR